jgi:hypothetical protein
MQRNARAERSLTPVTTAEDAPTIQVDELWAASTVTPGSKERAMHDKFSRRIEAALERSPLTPHHPRRAPPFDPKLRKLG